MVSEVAVIEGEIFLQQYLIVIEKVGKNYSAYSPDLSGCVATGRTKLETSQNMKKAIVMHIQGMKEDDLPIPAPKASADYCAV